MIIMLVIWLLLITFYFLFSKLKRIKIIPVTLFIAILAAGFGPFNAFDTSRRDQLEILQELLTTNNRFKNGKIVASAEFAVPDDEQRITDITNYLVHRFGPSVFYPYISDGLANQLRDSTWNEYVISEKLFAVMNVQPYYAGNPKEYKVLYHEWPEPVDIRGYDYYFSLTLFTYDERKEVSDNFNRNAKIHWTFKVPEQKLTIIADSMEAEIDIPQLARKVLRSETDNNRVIAASDMTFEQETQGIRIKMLIRNIVIDQSDPANKIQSLEATVLLKFDQ
jgi:hypothetical protein